jgi:hypothetical protein
LILSNFIYICIENYFNMKQITVTEKNHWESEVFSYILEVDDEMLNCIKNGLGGVSNVSILEDTTFTQESIISLNNKSSNSYMDRYQFNTLTLPDGEFDWYEDVFYKGVGLSKLSNVSK